MELLVKNGGCLGKLVKEVELEQAFGFYFVYLFESFEGADWC